MDSHLSLFTWCLGDDNRKTKEKNGGGEGLHFAFPSSWRQRELLALARCEPCAAAASSWQRDRPVTQRVSPCSPVSLSTALISEFPTVQTHRLRMFQFTPSYQKPLRTRRLRPNFGGKRQKRRDVSKLREFAWIRLIWGTVTHPSGPG